ncbi:MAG: peptide ABC transporter substrate-binding protein [Simkaniaceae bacterium]|nr:peptide ABC transporter substrate-binding protein [Simkaniaceae bacterium]
MRFLIVILSFFFLIGCDRGKPAKKTLKVNFAAEPSTLDPRKGGDIPSCTLQFMLYEGLVRYAKDPLDRFGIAERIDISDDKQTYTFHLRTSKWSDGHPLTALDFEYAYKSMVSPSFPCLNINLLYPIKGAKEIKEGLLPTEILGVTALDEKTLVINLAHPTPYFLDLLSFSIFFPIPQHLAEKDPNWANQKDLSLISNGPFVVSKWNHHESLLLIKNPYYWQKDSIHIDEIIVTLIGDQNTTLEMFERKELDILGVPFSSLPADAAKSLIEQNLLQARPTSGTSFLAFNLSKTFLNNPSIRKALSLSIDRELLIQNITQLGEKVATGITPPNLKRPQQQFFQFPCDPSLAQSYLKQGLEELGMTQNDIPPIDYLFNLNDPHKKIALAIQDAWREHLGITVNLRGVELKVYLDNLSSRNFDVSQSYLLAQFSDQLNILDRFKYRDNPKNHPGWYNPTYEALINHSFYLEKETRDRILSRAEALLIEEGAISPLYHWSSAAMVNPKLHGIYLSDINSIHFQGAYLDE